MHTCYTHECTHAHTLYPRMHPLNPPPRHPFAESKHSASWTTPRQPRSRGGRRCMVAGRPRPTRPGMVHSQMSKDLGPPMGPSDPHTGLGLRPPNPRGVDCYFRRWTPPHAIVITMPSTPHPALLVCDTLPCCPDSGFSPSVLAFIRRSVGPLLLPPLSPILVGMLSLFGLERVYLGLLPF